MQNAMKRNQLTREEMLRLLQDVQAGTLATINEDGTPYATPVHFLYYDEKIYIHGLPAGQKVDNIKRNGNISFSVYSMEGLLLPSAENPCKTGTKYQSVIIQGKASFLTEMEEKRKILEEIVRKYTPGLIGKELPDNMVKGTGILEIQISEMTGKYGE